jgi:sulfatase maturation enzyme AslB (radical SAM superfamily)
MTTPITLQQFRDLWIHTGTACNLSCPFCHEGSKPGDDRLQAITLAEVAPLMNEAAAQGVERFAFTGGEPLILREILPILLHALQLRPALVLTNGTAPFIRRSHQLAQLRAAPNPLSFRVSIDHPNEVQHDAGRGLKNFRKALEGLRLLLEAGFAVGITRQQLPGEDPRAVESKFRNLLRKQRLPEDLQLVPLPELGALGAPGDQTLPAVAAKGSAGTTVMPACSRSRMLLKRSDTLRLAPCPLVDDDPTFDASSDLLAALDRPTAPRHRRCQTCLQQGVNYIGLPESKGV